MILPLAYYGNPILRRKAEPIEKITPELHILVKDMAETMKANDGWGLAAPQVHRSIRLFVICIDDEDPHGSWNPGEVQVYINPVLSVPLPSEIALPEGCLSIPGAQGTVIRPAGITITAMNLEGETFTKTLSGLLARIVMHENDHLNGVLYIDRIDQKQRQSMDPLLKKIKKKYKSKSPG